MRQDEHTGAAYGGPGEIRDAATGFFRVSKIAGKWWLVTPEGQVFVSIGLNHLDETDLKYPSNIEIWRLKYGSRARWIDGAVHDLKAWGFNTIGWTRQWVTGRHNHDVDWLTPLNLGHGTAWSPDELRQAGMPYVQQLRVAAVEGWNGNPVFPDFEIPGSADRVYVQGCNFDL